MTTLSRDGAVWICDLGDGETPAVAHAAMTGAQRYDAHTAADADIVDTAAPADQLIATAVEYAQRQSVLRGPNLRAIKTIMYEAVLLRLSEIVTA